MTSSESKWADKNIGIFWDMIFPERTINQMASILILVVLLSTPMKSDTLSGVLDQDKGLLPRNQLNISLRL